MVAASMQKSYSISHNISTKPTNNSIPELYIFDSMEARRNRASGRQLRSLYNSQKEACCLKPTPYEGRTY